jgi:hypothetical protein
MMLVRFDWLWIDQPKGDLLVSMNPIADHCHEHQEDKGRSQQLCPYLSGDRRTTQQKAERYCEECCRAVDRRVTQKNGDHTEFE